MLQTNNVARTLDISEIKNMLYVLRKAYGYDFTNYADSSIIRRTAHFMSARKLIALDDLQRALLSDERLFEDFVQNVSVTVTEMFRDPMFFKILRLDILKRLATYPFIKIWVAGCATGEEAYSIAIILKEEGLLERSIIYATDINQNSIDLAREGIFPLDNMKNYTTNYQRSGGMHDFSDYYIANYNSALFHKSLKKNIVFSAHNLATDGSFNEFNLILCRNVLIYFNHDLQNKVIDLFHESLCTFGFLGLGNKESISFTHKALYFDIVDKKEKLFMKVR
jgi:chemotaxis protein methyltransferase CheR